VTDPPGVASGQPIDTGSGTRLSTSARVTTMLSSGLPCPARIGHAAGRSLADTVPHARRGAS
jgi:hypothetical protein